MNLLIDIDHVLSDALWRDHLADEKRWDEYHSSSAKDVPIQPVRRLINSLRGLWTVFGLTARPERWRATTVEWCVRHDVELDELLMRGNTDFRPAPQVKIDIIMNRFTELERSQMIVIDDRDDVVAKMVENKINAFQAFTVMRRMV